MTCEDSQAEMVNDALNQAQREIVLLQLLEVRPRASFCGGYPHLTHPNSTSGMKMLRSGRTIVHRGLPHPCLS